MANHGYVTHAARNRRYAFFLALIYVLAFELIGALALVMPLLVWDPEHTILSDPAGYLLRYALPLAAFSVVLFGWIYRGHAASVARSLRVSFVTRAQEPRFVTVAEEVCTTLGVRAPRFGVIEQSQPNAVTAGEGPERGLIAVTRGLLDALDDDELAAVLAHEASHIRLGDTQALAASHALMRTALAMQTINPLRIEDKRQLLLLVLVPPMAVILLGSGAIAMLALRLARFARGRIKLSRDHIADGEAVRVTHFPEALMSALRKIAGRGAFAGSWRIEPLLFDGATDREGGSHPTVEDRLAAIASLGRDLLKPARGRRDTRVAAGARFGRRLAFRASAFQYDREGRPLGQKPDSTFSHLLLFVTDREAFWDWREAVTAWAEWRVSDRRNAVGLKPLMILPVLAALCVSVALWSYVAKDWRGAVRMFDPTRLVEIAQRADAGPFCFGPTYAEGKCPGQKAANAFVRLDAGAEAGKRGGAPATGFAPTSNTGGSLLQIVLTAAIAGFVLWRRSLRASKGR